MRKKVLLGLDLGTTGCRAEIFSPTGQSLGRAYREYGLCTPEPGAAEQEPAEWWDNLLSCIRDVLCSSGTAGAQVAAIGVSAQGHSWLPVGENLRPLRRAMTWLDTRADTLAQSLLTAYGVEFWGTVAGKLPGAWHMLPQLLWLRDNDPQTLEGARALLCAHDWLVGKLCGRPMTDYTTAAASLLLDITTCTWRDELLAEYAIEPGLLPPLVPAGTVAGTVCAPELLTLGIADDTPVAVGSQDQKCAALAAGLESGVATASLGTATALVAPIDTPRFDHRHGAIPCFPFLERDRHVLEAPLATTGGALRWWRDILGGAAQVEYASLMRLAARARPGSDGVVFFPYLAGAGAPHWQGSARGGFNGLSLRSGTGEMVRAVLEATAYDLRECLDGMRRAGCSVKRLRVFGGGARSRLWCAIIAAVCRCPVEVCADSEMAVRGAAMFAASAAGMAREALRLPVHTVKPFPRWMELYDNAFLRYQKARSAYWQLDTALSAEDGATR